MALGLGMRSRTYCPMFLHYGTVSSEAKIAYAPSADYHKILLKCVQWISKWISTTAANFPDGSHSLSHGYGYDAKATPPGRTTLL